MRKREISPMITSLSLLDLHIHIQLVSFLDPEMRGKVAKMSYSIKSKLVTYPLKKLVHLFAKPTGFSIRRHSSNKRKKERRRCSKSKLDDSMMMMMKKANRTRSITSSDDDTRMNMRLHTTTPARRSGSTTSWSSDDDDCNGGGGGGDVEDACRLFEKYLMDMIVQDGKVGDLTDVEDLLSSWNQLKSPIFIDLVSTFYGELCLDLFSHQQQQQEAAATAL